MINVRKHTKAHVLTTMQTLIPPEGGQMSMAWIARKAGLSRRHVHTIVGMLEQDGLLEIKRRDGAPCTYHFRGRS
jgi:DNA-binding GntR family transcriptional regulator